MSLSFYSLSNKILANKSLSNKNQSIAKALKSFTKSELSTVSKEVLLQASQLYQQINSSHQKIFIFAFGGIGASFKIAQSFFSLKNRKANLVNAFDLSIVKKISGLSKKELRASHFIFISKSGQTSEILFYKQLIQKTYLKRKLSLKNRLTILTQKQNSSLFLWAKKEKASLVFLEKSLTGRFSFFSLVGFLQFQSCGLKIKAKELPFFCFNPQLYNFFQSLLSKKEVYFCYFQKELSTISNWLEMSWSESLFKEDMKKPLPVLRSISWSDLRHGFIEELISKKNQSCFLGLDLKQDKANKLSKDELSFFENLDFYQIKNSGKFKSDEYKLKKLLKTKKIPCLFISSEKTPADFLELIFFFYQILFLAGSYAKIDIKTQSWVDYFKN